MTQTIIEARAADLFDGLKPEKKQDQKDFKVDKKGLDDIIKGFEEVIRAIVDKENYFAKLYQCCEKNIPQEYTARDIEKFSIVLAQYQEIEEFEERSALYLSALINHSSEQRFIVHTSHLTHLTRDIHHFGYKNNGKQITVKGDVGMSVGDEMESGEIHIEGNAGPYVGNQMFGGKIHVQGHTGGLIGIRMHGGEIYIHGDVGSCIGDKMRGGVIHIGGDYGSISDEIKGGDIFHKEKQIVKDGKLVK